MDRELIKFLQDINGERQIAQIDGLLAFYNSILPEVSDIFFEVFKKGNSYEYGKLYLFSKKYHVIIPDFSESSTESITIQIIPITENINFLEITLQNFNFIEARLTSKIEIKI